MKKIVLFSRCELTHLYGRISTHLSEKYKVIHVGYSQSEVNILKHTYDIDNVICFNNEIVNIYKDKSYSEIELDDIDRVIIEQSRGRFNLNGAMQYDRTFEYLDYSSNLELVKIYFKFWDNFLKKSNIDFLVHEATSLFFNHIASVLGKENKAKYITCVQVYGESEINFAVAEGDDGSFTEMKVYSSNDDIDIDRVTAFLDNFRPNSDTFFNIYIKKRNSFFNMLKFSIFSFSKIFIKYFYSRVKLIVNKYSILDHVEIFHLKSISFFKEIKNHYYYYYRLKYEESSLEENYYYYPLHLEPEAVVLYWGDGLYNNQVKLIENIAAQIPPDRFLYVKDHPHAGSYRDYEDYVKIKSISNVKLLEPSSNGKKVIAKSIGVITINGTSGFEALLLNKQVYTFGNCFFNQCKRVNYIKNIKDLRESLYLSRNLEYEDDDELFGFINLYLNSIHPGFTDYFIDFPKLIGVDEEINSKTVANELSKYFGKF